MVPSVSLMEIAVVVGVFVVAGLGAVLVVRLLRGVPSKPDSKKKP